jgi:hypothetical protein
MSSQILIQKRSESLQPILDEIYDLLLLKSRREGKPPNYLNMTYLGGTGFWIQYDEEKKLPFLCYNRHPENWGNLQNIRDELMVIRHKLEVRV